LINRNKNQTKRKYIPDLRIGMIPVRELNWLLTLARKDREDRTALSLWRLASDCVVDGFFAKAADGMMFEVGGG
jgi:hypothetical protein